MNLSFSSESPKNAKDEAESMFGPSWVHAKGEKADGHFYEEIFCKVFHANPKALLRLLKTSLLGRTGKTQ